MADKVLKEATMKPIDKFNKVLNGLELIMASDEAKKYCVDWGFEVNDGLLEIDAQLIPPPVVMCKS